MNDTNWTDIGELRQDGRRRLVVETFARSYPSGKTERCVRLTPILDSTAQDPIDLSKNQACAFMALLKVAIEDG